MIKSFKHKGLEKFFLTGSVKGINPDHAKKIQRILTQLNRAKVIGDMNAPDYKLHPLKGNMKDLWSVTVKNNWRITFMFENGNAYILDYQDYH
jgi:proteic killer suppression protein